jgi:hypothetical protein
MTSAILINFIYHKH